MIIGYKILKSIFFILCTFDKGKPKESRIVTLHYIINYQCAHAKRTRIHNFDHR